jgi:hypothetical protein
MRVSQYRLATALPNQLQGQLPTREEFAREMPYLSLVAVRIEIERTLQRFMTFRRIEPSGVVGIGEAIRQLKESGEAPPGTDAFLRALAVMNQAVHGLEVEPSAMTDALKSSSEFLVQLRQLVEE